MAADADLGVAVRDRGAYLPAADALVVADIHLGRGATADVALPIGDESETVDRIADLVDRFDPAEVVVAGDVLHDFSGIPDGVEAALTALRDAVAAAGSRLVLVRGNHDAALDALADPVDEHPLRDGETVVCHGHEPPATPAERYVVGHVHPAIVIERRRRPCALIGERAYQGAGVIALPAFTRLAAGTPVNGLRGDDATSPLLADIDAFRPVVRDEAADATYAFPPLGALRDLV